MSVSFDFSKKEPVKTIQELLQEIANHPDVPKVGFSEMKVLFERQLLLSALERNFDDPRRAAAELKMSHPIMRYHLKHSLGKKDVTFREEECTTRRIEVESVKVEEMKRQRRLKF